MTVLDASAIRALAHDGPGADQVAAELTTATLGTADRAWADVDLPIRVRLLR